MWIDKGYLHEVWLYPDSAGSKEVRPSCVAFGPAGDAARALSQEIKENTGECVWIFYADSHQEAMTLYYEFIGFGDYVSNDAWDFERYPDFWYQEQKDYLMNLLKSNV